MTASSRFDEKSFSEQLSELHKLSNEIEQMFAKLIMLFYESCDEYAARGHKLNVLITGATGAGKSSTINALSNSTVARVGYGVDPETMDIEKYDLDEMVLWDTPGLGDGEKADKRHARNIIHKLAETDSSGKALIDLVLVILDGGSRDLGTSYDLIHNVIMPNLGKRPKARLLVAINQCDVAMKGQHWDREKNCPDRVLTRFLEEKAVSVQRRIQASTGVEIDLPVFYSAGYTENGCRQIPYNLSKLLNFIRQHAPTVTAA